MICGGIKEEWRFVSSIRSCSLCEEEAVVSERYSGRTLCREHCLKDRHVLGDAKKRDSHTEYKHVVHKVEMKEDEKFYLDFMEENGIVGLDYK